jgi:hypothetical protein
MIFLILIILCLLLLNIYLTGRDRNKPLFSKSLIAFIYDVHIDTFNDWIEAFMPRRYFNQWKTKRKFSINNIMVCEKYFNFPIHVERTTRALIAKSCNMTTKDVMITVEDPGFAFNYDKYCAFKVYPPRIGDKLVSLLLAD